MDTKNTTPTLPCGDDDLCRVSIICTCYNHQNFISKAIESFLSQDAPFGFEILIHDDCSSDDSRVILREYEKNYPEQIRVVLSEDNQLSKGINPITSTMLPLAKGPYIAICEGDDFWLDKHKLSRQLKKLSENPDISFVTSSAVIVNKDGVATGMTKSLSSRKSKKVSFEWVLRNGGGFYPTASIMFRKKAFEKGQWLFEMAAVGDFGFALMLSSQGRCFSFDEPMVAYRVHGDSYTRTRTQSDIKRIGSANRLLFQHCLDAGLINLKLKKELVVREQYQEYSRLVSDGHPLHLSWQQFLGQLGVLLSLRLLMKTVYVSWLKAKESRFGFGHHGS